MPKFLWLLKRYFGHVVGHGQEAENSFPTKFCSLPWWFSYDDDCSSLQTGRHNICRLLLVGFYLFCCLIFPRFTSNYHILAYYTGVHDSYWTHACNVDEMNRILREKFVELYETPILENVQSILFLNSHVKYSKFWAFLKNQIYIM